MLFWDAGQFFESFLSPSAIWPPTATGSAEMAFRNLWAATCALCVCVCVCVCVWCVCVCVCVVCVCVCVCCREARGRGRGGGGVVNEATCEEMS